MTVSKALPYPLDHNANVINIPLGKIIRSETNREVEVDDAFVASIREHGVLQPVIVREIEATLDLLNVIPPEVAVVLGGTIYKLVAGERRWLGSKKANRASIPAIIRELTDTQALTIQANENLQREDLSPMDRCHLFCHLRDQYMKDHAGDKKYNASQCMEDLARNFGVEERSIRDVISLGKLDKFAQDALRQGEMGQSHGYEIARLEGPQQQQVLAWLRKETYPQGDIPSVRRLKREISAFQIAWDEKKRQASLPLDETFAGKEEKVQTSAVSPVARHFYEQQAAQPKPKPLSQAQIKKNEAAAAAEKLAHEKRLRKGAREARIDKHYRAALFAALASRVKISSRFLSRIVPQLISDLWDAGDVPFDQTLARTLGWPMPVNPEGYVFSEWPEHSRRHTRKFTPGLLAALVMSLNMIPSEMERLGRYFSVDTKRLRAHAAAAVKAEEKAAKLAAKKKVAA